MCPPPSFLATDAFYSGVHHVLTAIEVPLHIFGAYVIVTRTPSKMSSVKASLLLLHLVGAYVDVYLSFVTTPVLTLPGCLGYFLGVTLWLGLPSDVMSYWDISLVGVLAVTILIFFEDRYFRLTKGPTAGSRSWKRVFYVVLHYFLSVTFIAPAYYNKMDQQLGRQLIKQLIPCIPAEVPARPDFIILDTDKTLTCWCVGLMFVFLFPQVIFFVFQISWYLYHTVSQSQATNRLQKQFFVALCIQVFIPFALLCFPVIYIIFAIYSGYYNQAATNVAQIAVSCHGILSTLTMLIVHKPYRQETLEFVNIEMKQNTVRSITGIDAKI
ncbi:Serpentine Receptor, class H [Caenorhabditis elegans]|uniref:Serpentine Receptor, class H n=1 Tax=Caenorhabditis elegans TaxID=6239 RepID=O46011_CAEEL|nr:Serpentine Receptor, class H [Caenorhabditis elegans]CAB04997.1 Serpentine Receptor, class H [Caenorhabditis elegans]|eukprot:NP_507617.1 Serpentine Receptor, class H [Caenorhabditis elegans]